MSTQDGQKSCPHCSNPNAQSATQPTQMLTPAQLELLDYADALDGPDVVKSLKLLHDVVIYHSYEPIDEEEKNALFHLKGLWECIERIIA